MDTKEPLVLQLLKTKTPINVNFIRYGNKNDGGYVIVDDLTDKDYVITLGVDKDLSFEEDIQDIVSGFDLYDSSKEYNKLNENKSRFFLEHIGSENGETSLKQVVDRVEDKNKNLILKMDIEGSEWSVLQKATSSLLSKFRQIIIEFHVGFVGKFHDYKVLEKINKTHQAVIVHGNNCAGRHKEGDYLFADVFEVTYLRKSDYEFSYGENPGFKLLSSNKKGYADMDLYTKLPTNEPKNREQENE